MIARYAWRLTGPVLAVTALLLTSVPTFAHASLIESDPVDGGTVAMPYVVVLRFDEELTPFESSFEVRDAGGNVVAEGGIVEGEDNFTMDAELDALPLGTYQVHWVAITADDSGKTQGDLSFSVVQATPSPSAAPSITLPAPASATPAATVTPPQASVTPPPSAVTVETPAPTPGPPTTQASGAELIVPLVLAGGVVVALVWILLRRRST